MAERKTLEIYVVVDEDGQYSASTDSSSDARDNYDSDHGGGDQLETYKIELSVELPGEKVVRLVSGTVPASAPSDFRGSVRYEPEG